MRWRGTVRSGGGGLRNRGYSVFAFLGFLSLTLSIQRLQRINLGFFFLDKHAHGKFGIFFFLNRINLINGLVQTFGLKQVVIWAYFVLWA